jgi:hypothetical protein
MQFGDLKELTALYNPCPHANAQNGAAHALGPFVRMLELVNGPLTSTVRYWFQIRWSTAERTSAGGLPKSALKASHRVAPDRSR